MTAFKPTLIAALLMGSAWITSPALAADAPLTRVEVEKIVRETLQKNPELVYDALMDVQKKHYEDEQKQKSASLKSYGKQLYNDAADPVIGNPKGNTTIVEFFDYNCGYCKHLFPTLTQLIKDDKEVRIVLKEFPILGASSMAAAQAALAVHRIAPNKYFDFHSELMTGNGALDEARFMAAAKKLGIDEAKLKAEIAKPDVAAQIAKNNTLGKAVGIGGTPAVVVNEELIPGAVDLNTLKAKIKAAREKK